MTFVPHGHLFPGCIEGTTLLVRLQNFQELLPCPMATYTLNSEAIQEVWSLPDTWGTNVRGEQIS